MTQSKRIGLYTGSFDPVTLGHLDIIKRSFTFVDQLVVAIGIHPVKTPFLSNEERVALLTEACLRELPERKEQIKIVQFSNLSVDAAKEYNALVMVRGLRNATDFDYEMNLAGMNQSLHPSLQTVFIPASAGTQFITATHVRQIAAMQGNIRAFVPENVAKHIEAKFNFSSPL